ncbi:MAG: ATP-binding cassette domain-containing protein [Gammaproteobacteria bacterium]|nr:ATP-binding cassette domain-containing protein [Gammaproteobacteria bacterium]
MQSLSRSHPRGRQRTGGVGFDVAEDLPVVRARGLTKQYDGVAVVRGIDLCVERGQCFGLLGPNGAGKTTTIKMILGQSPLSGGDLRVFGQRMPAHGRTLRARIGVVPQLDNLDPDFTVAENLRVYGSFFGLAEAVLTQRIHTLLAFVGLADRGHTKITSLSGGMMRRLTIARALVNDPELLVFDEPTTGLDPQARHMIWARLRDLKAQGKTLLLTTHYMEEAERLCDNLVIMDAGRVLTEGPPLRLIKQFVEPHVFEVYAATEEIKSALGGLGACRTEQVDNTLYCYAREPGAVNELLRSRSALRFLHRPADLEDVFLRITGRDLRE